MPNIQRTVKRMLLMMVLLIPQFAASWGFPKVHDGVMIENEIKDVRGVKNAQLDGDEFGNYPPHLWVKDGKFTERSKRSVCVIILNTYNINDYFRFSYESEPNQDYEYYCDTHKTMRDTIN